MGRGFPFLDKTAGTVARTLVEQVITRFLHTGGDPHRPEMGVRGCLVPGVCRLLGIQKTQTTPFHPQSDGMVERFNRTVKTMLSMFVADNQAEETTQDPAGGATRPASRTVRGTGPPSGAEK